MQFLWYDYVTRYWYQGQWLGEPVAMVVSTVAP